MSERGLSILDLARLHRNFARKPRRRLIRQKRPAPAQEAEDRERPADSQQRELFESEGEE